MKPYYEEDGIVIYHGDCREVLPQLSYETVVTDPPYNVGIDFGSSTNDKQDSGEYEQWCTSWFRLLRGKGALLTPGIGNLAMWMKTNPRWVIAWVKNNSMRRITIGFNCWEPVLVWGKVATNLYRDVIEVPTVPQAIDHPTPKPLSLFQTLIKGFSHGGTICDPFCGSGTTLEAAKNLHQSAIGIEIEEKYCEIAAKRLSQKVFQFSNPLPSTAEDESQTV